MRKPIQTIISVIFFFSALQAGPSVYLYIIKFDNVTQESSIDWLGDGFVNMLNAKLVDVSKLRLKGQDDLEAIMNNRSLLLHQPRGSRNFLLLGKYERKLDNVKVSLQLIDIATWEEADRRKINGNYNEVSDLNMKLTTTVEFMLTAFIPIDKKKKSIYPEFTIDKSESKKSTIFTNSKDVSRNIDKAIDELEKSMDLVIGARGVDFKDETLKKGEEWVLELGSSSQPSYNPENDANSLMLMKVLDDLMSSPYNIIIKKPLFEFDVENVKNMNVSIQIEYSLKEHIIADMLKSLPYTGLKQDGTLMVFDFNKEKFNFSDAIRKKIRFGKYRAIPVISFLNEFNKPAVLIVDSPEAAIHRLESRNVHYVTDHKFSPLIDFTIGGWSMQIAMESVKIPVRYSFILPIETADSIRRISLKFVPEAELSTYLQSIL
jgi:TolB-like protein